MPVISTRALRGCALRACALLGAALSCSLVGCSPESPLRGSADAREAKPRAVASAKSSPKSRPTNRRAGEWSEVAPGVEMRRLSWEDGGRRVPVVALRAAPSRLRVVVGASGQALEAGEWRARAGAVAAFNGGFFDAQGRSLGVRLSRGRLLSKPHGSRWSVLRVKKIAGRQGTQGGEARIVSAMDFADALKRGVRYEEAVQCGPLLAKAGSVGSFKDQWARRTGLGIDQDGRLIVAACDEAMSMRGWALCFVRGLNCPDALNLDGGSSTQMSLRAGSASLEWGGGRTVPDAVAIR